MKNKNFTKWFLLFLIIISLITFSVFFITTKNIYYDNNYDIELTIPANRYPETAQHIRDAILKGKSSICTIDRNRAKERRRESLKGIPAKSGYDRDEYPPAMCLEGGTGADIRYVTPSDNRGAGSWMGHQLSDYLDGTKIHFKN